MLVLIGLGSMSGCAMPASGGAPPTEPIQAGTAAAANILSSKATFPPGDGFLFVGNNDGNNKLGSVSVYDSTDGKMPAKIIENDISDPDSFAVAQNGDLYVSNNGNVNFPGSIVQYAGHSGKVVRTITNGISHPDGLALDTSGNVYAANFEGNAITVYGSQGTQPTKTITDGVSMPESMLFDAKGDLFVSNFAALEKGHQKPGWVSEYAPNTLKLLARFASGLETPGAIALNSSNSLLAVGDTHSNRILEYDVSAVKLVRTITKDIAYPESAAFDASDNLYVLSDGYGKFGTGAVLVFPSGSSKPTAKITEGVHYPSSMKLDSEGDVYVSNLKKCLVHGPCNDGSVSIYTAQSFKLAEQIQKGLNGAATLMLGK
jgi:DNA-binding beta-propeller fold protein YncE